MAIKTSKKKRAHNRLLAQLDALARAAVMERDGYKCQRCGTTDDLQWSHVLSRRHHCIRWEPDNSQPLCRGCHCWWTNHPLEAAYWFSKNWPMRWERVHELVRTGGPMKDHALRELLESMMRDMVTP